MSDCIFCKIIAKGVPSNVVYENDKVFAFLDINPINKGHTLVVPKEHHDDMLSTPDALLAEMMTTTKNIAAAVVKAVNADGFNIGVNTKRAAGQLVFHTHFHIIPRFEDDGHKHWPGKKLPEEEMQQIQEAIRKKL